MLENYLGAQGTFKKKPDRQCLQFDEDLLVRGAGAAGQNVQRRLYTIYTYW